MSDHTALALLTGRASQPLGSVTCPGGGGLKALHAEAQGYILQTSTADVKKAQNTVDEPLTALDGMEAQRKGYAHFVRELSRFLGFTDRPLVSSGESSRLSTPGTSNAATPSGPVPLRWRRRKKKARLVRVDGVLERTGFSRTTIVVGSGPGHVEQRL